MMRELEKHDISNQLLLAKEVERTKDRKSEDIKLNTPRASKFKIITSMINCCKSFTSKLNLVNTKVKETNKGVL